MSAVFQYVIDRLKEPSTYAGLGTLLTAIGWQIDPALWKEIAGVCMGIGGLLAVILTTRITPSTIVESGSDVKTK